MGAVEAVQNTKKAQDPNLIELSSGVVLRLLGDVDPMTLMDVMSRLEEGRPKVPTVFIKALGRHEQNTEDPDYQARLSSWSTRYALEMANALILLGTEIKSTPRGFPKPRDDKWLAKLRVLKIDYDESPEGRYLAWVKHVAIKSAEDMNKVTSAVGRVAGVSEADVEVASESFQD